MISETLVVVEAPGVLRHVHSAPPLTVRQVLSEQDGICTVCLVGSAAGPLAGDDLTLRIDVAAGSQASLTAAGATIAQGGGPDPARLAIVVSVGAGARLDADPGALIVCANARVDVSVSITLAESAQLRWRELVVLGRSGEPGGRAALDWSVRRAGRPLLRQRIDLTVAADTAWPGLLGASRVLDSTLNVGFGVAAATVVHSAWHVTQKLAGDATLTTRLDAGTA